MTTNNPLFVGILVALFVFFLTATGSWWLRGRALEQKKADDSSLEIDKLRADLAEMKTAQGILATKIDPFWKVLQDNLGDSLHHPDDEHREMDGYIDALRMGTITDEQRADLTRRLNGIVGSGEPENVRNTAGAMLGIMPLVIDEARNLRALATKTESEKATKS